MYRLVAPQNIEAMWPKVAPWIALACGLEPEAWQDVGYIKPPLLIGAMQLWVGEAPGTQRIDCVLITESTLIGSEPTLSIRWGTMTELHSRLIDIGLIESWARQNGYVNVQIWGRPGFRKVMKPYGYELKFEVIERKLGQGVH